MWKPFHFVITSRPSRPLTWCIGRWRGALSVTWRTFGFPRTVLQRNHSYCCHNGNPVTIYCPLTSSYQHEHCTKQKKYHSASKTNNETSPIHITTSDVTVVVLWFNLCRPMEVVIECSWINKKKYCKTSNIRCTLIGNKIVNHSDVVGASPVGAAPTASSFST